MRVQVWIAFKLLQKRRQKAVVDGVRWWGGGALTTTRSVVSSLISLTAQLKQSLKAATTADKVSSSSRALQPLLNYMMIVSYNRAELQTVYVTLKNVFLMKYLLILLGCLFNIYCSLCNVLFRSGIHGCQREMFRETGWRGKGGERKVLHYK